MLDSESWLFEGSSDLDFPLPQCLLLLRCWCSLCSLSFFTGKGIFLCYSISTEALGRSTTSACDGDRDRAGRDIFVLSLFYAQFSCVKEEWGGLKDKSREIIKQFYIFLSSPSSPVPKVPSPYRMCVVKGGATPFSGQKHSGVQSLLRCLVK